MYLRPALWTAVLISFTPSLSHAQAAMADADFVKAAESGASADIASKAAIVRLDAKGATTVVRAGTNGFTCTVGVPGDPTAPFCADANAWTWLVSAVTGQPKPTNSAPGIAYMAQGGVHYESATRDVVMMPNATTHPVKEPPHWMLMWAFDPATSGLPTKENASGVYIMFAGTPYAHLMIYQNPTQMAK
ncbi:MAG TPA: hypothetical protein VN848_03730 [Gemmatimonadales bacterium]|nr:hypothetical protein [Gemmatimonadales bacterium]